MDVVFVYIVDLIRKGLQEEGFPVLPSDIKHLKKHVVTMNTNKENVSECVIYINHLRRI